MGILNRIRNDIQYLINEYKTKNPLELIECLGIILVEEPLKDGLNGCYQEIAGFQFIYINSDLPYYKKLMVAAHELGHARLHRGQNILFLTNKTQFVKGKFERQANLYSAELLLDDDFFEKYKDEDCCTLDNICQNEYISSQLVSYKLENLNK